MSNGSTKNNYKTYKILITVLIVILFCCFGYMYNISSRSKAVIIELKSEKLAIIQDLEKAKLNLVATASKNKQLSEQLLIEKQKIDAIISQLNKPGVTNDIIAKYKNYVTKLTAKVDSLSKKVTNYKSIIDSSTLIIAKNETEKKALIKEKSELQSKIETVSNNLYFYNLSAVSIKKRESGKIIQTQNASRVNNIIIKFEIAENKLATKQAKVFYYQIIDSKNNVIGLKATAFFDKKELVYSDLLNVQFNLKITQVEKTIAVQNLEPGTYLLNVFDTSKLVLKTTFMLE